MATKIDIQFKISRQRVEALNTLYTYVISEYVPGNKVEILLQAHTVDMQWRLEVLLKKKFINTSFTMSEAEAIAFVLCWDGWDITDPLANVVVNDILAFIDKQSKQPKPRNY